MALKGKVNILIVDDRPENLVAMEAILDNDDYHLVKASSGEEALKYLLKENIALILLDVHIFYSNQLLIIAIVKMKSYHIVD